VIDDLAFVARHEQKAENEHVEIPQFGPDQKLSLIREPVSCDIEPSLRRQKADIDQSRPETGA
jgi:hypothetical protein